MSDPSSSSSSDEDHLIEPARSFVFGDQGEENSGSEEDDLLEVMHMRLSEKQKTLSKTKEYVYDSDAIAQRAAAIKLTIPGIPEPIPFIESLTLTSPKPLLLEDADDDLERERLFYEVALSSVKQAEERLMTKIPYKRPEDYFAEMMKSDEHMTKVKSRLLKERREMVEAASRRKQRDSKKFAKQVASERVQARSKEKKVELEAIKKWKKLHKKQDYQGEGEFPPELLDPNSALRKELDGTGDTKTFVHLNKAQQPQKPRITKAQLKAKKYGGGGKKGKHHKANNADSFMEGSFNFNHVKNKEVASEFRRGTKARGGGGPKTKSNRPGKRARQGGSGGSGRPSKKPRH